MQLLFISEAVDNLIVHRSTDRKGKAFKALERRGCARLANQLFSHLIQMQRRCARFNFISQRFQHAVQQRARLAHFFNL